MLSIPGHSKRKWRIEEVRSALGFTTPAEEEAWQANAHLAAPKRLATAARASAALLEPPHLKAEAEGGAPLPSPGEAQGAGAGGLAEQGDGTAGDKVSWGAGVGGGQGVWVGSRVGAGA